MKRLLIAFAVLFCLSGCKCLIAQIPAQYIYSGANCEAPLPSFLDRIHATDNCVLASLVQTPAPGFMLGPTNMIVNVVVKATDATGNSSQVTFTVALIDTVPPVITVDDTLITSDAMDMIKTLYNQADRIILSKVEEFDAKFPYAELGLPIPDSTTLANEYLIMTRTPLKRSGDIGRVFQFYNFPDTINN